MCIAFRIDATAGRAWRASGPAPAERPRGGPLAQLALRLPSLPLNFSSLESHFSSHYLIKHHASLRRYLSVRQQCVRAASAT
jgi:hypothetical protein